MRFGLGPMTLESVQGWRCAGCRKPAGGCCGRKQVDIYEEVLEHAVTAEWWGFDSVWVDERHFTPDSFNSSASVVAAGLSQRTEFVRVGMMPVLGLVNSIYVAEEVACIDNINAGRTIVAGQVPNDEIVRGWAGSGASNSADRIVDDIAVLRKAWGPNPFSHHSEFHNIPMNNEEIHVEARGLDRISVQPKPAQLDMPLWMSGGTEAAEVARRTGVPYMAPGHLTLEQMRPLYEGLNPTFERVVPLIRDVFIAPTTDEAQRLAGAAIRDLYNAQMRAGLELSSSDFDKLVMDTIIIGDPDTCIERLYAYERELGVNYVVARLAYHNMHPGDTARAIQLFGQGVVPEFRMFGLPDEIRKVV
jgi:alkanesulfonate monooxygenase SsuD/methylene tetrahydromethanopterin reductase-like flavin-dependent oxidoreductase (luciferase family)